MDNLKPCPFCGEIENLHIDRYQCNGEWFAYVECKDCICTGPVSKLKKDAIDAWNRRVK